MIKLISLIQVLVMVFGVSGDLEDPITIDYQDTRIMVYETVDTIEKFGQAVEREGSKIIGYDSNKKEVYEQVEGDSNIYIRYQYPGLEEYKESTVYYIEDIPLVEVLKK